MTLTPINSPTDRKDTNTLILNQMDAPCLPRGMFSGEDEGFMAFLVRLYAYFVSKFYDEMADAKRPQAYSPLMPRCEGTTRLKARLLTSGPYQMSASQREEQRPHTPVVTSVPRSLAKRGWLILWPGAARHIYIKTGRSAPAFYKTGLIFKVPNRAKRYVPSITPVTDRAFRLAPLCTLPKVRIIQRLIPP